jgi:hypothetical protein
MDNWVCNHVYFIYKNFFHYFLYYQEYRLSHNIIYAIKYIRIWQDHLNKYNSCIILPMPQIYIYIISLTGRNN